MKTITATPKGIAINYERTEKSSFIPYETMERSTQNRVNRFGHYQMNTIQYGLYQQLMHGMKAYDQDQINTMSESAKFTIRNKHMRATEVINKMKYEKTYGYINKLFDVIFPQIKLDYYKDGRFADLPTLRELKISTVDIIDAWISEKLLPLDFYSLNEQSLKL
jgi:hypothetical protein